MIWLMILTTIDEVQSLNARYIVYLIFTLDDHNLHTHIVQWVLEKAGPGVLSGPEENCPAQRGDSCQERPAHNTVAAICLCTSAVTASFV